jgi:hypothetical protein
MIELLELVGRSGLQSEATQYATIKLYLDMATSLLVFAGAYRPSYEERAREIERLSTDTPEASMPFSLDTFAEKVQYCTQLKLATSECSSSALHDDSKVSERLFVEGVRLAHQLWRWELQRMLGLDLQTSDRDLLAHWAESQAGAAKLRGWVRVMRDAGSANTRKNWKRWLGLARRTSPRLAVYAAGCQLFFQIPQLMQGRQTELFEDLSNSLPVCPDRSGDGRIGWPLMATSIAENYHRFVEFTRT